MGHWLLEVTKIGIYITLPLSSFILFNSPSFYVPVLYEWRIQNKQFTIKNELAQKQQENDYLELQKLHQEFNEKHGN